MTDLMKLETREQYDAFMVPNNFYEIPEELYHSLPPLGQSNLCKYELSPAHFNAARAGAFKTSPQMRLGSAIHTAILEPHLFNDLYTGIPDELIGKSKVCREYKTWKSGQTKIIFDLETLEQITTIANHALHHPSLSPFLYGGESELVGIATDPDTGILIKARYDKIFRQAHMIVDLKTTSKRVGSKQYMNSMVDFNYIVQGAYYKDIAKLITGEDFEFLLVAVEVEPPYEMLMYKFDEDTLSLGRAKYRRYLDIHKQCTDNKTFGGYVDPIREFRAPDWSFRQEGLEELLT